jgi:hypothetical protein
MATKGIPYLAERIEFIESALSALLRNLEVASGPRMIALEHVIEEERKVLKRLRSQVLH